VLEVHQEAEMGEEVDTIEGWVTSATTKSHIKSRLSTTLRMKDSHLYGIVVSRTEVVVDAFLASRNEPAGVHAEVRTRVYQELSFTEPIRDVEAARGRSTGMCLL
jgi:hypothetical protein